MSSARGWPDQPRQAHGAAVDQRHAPAAAEHAEHGVLLGDAQIAPQRELEPARNGVARDRGDHRLGQAHARGAHRAVAAGLDPVARPRCRRPSDRRRRRTSRPRRGAPRPRPPCRPRRRGTPRPGLAAVGPSTALRRSGPRKQHGEDRPVSLDPDRHRPSRESASQAPAARRTNVRSAARIRVHRRPLEREWRERTRRAPRHSPRRAPPR